MSTERTPVSELAWHFTRQHSPKPACGMRSYHIVTPATATPKPNSHRPRRGLDRCATDVWRHDVNLSTPRGYPNLEGPFSLPFREAHQWWDARAKRRRRYASAVILPRFRPCTPGSRWALTGQCSLPMRRSRPPELGARQPDYAFLRHLQRDRPTLHDIEVRISQHT